MKSREINSLFKNLNRVIKNPKSDLKYKNKFTLKAKQRLSNSSYETCRDIADKIAVDVDNDKLHNLFIKRQDTLRNIDVNDYFNFPAK